jgi:serine/threonine protein kinase
MKVIDKSAGKKHGKRIKAEREIFSKLDHPFIVKLHYAFKTVSKRLRENYELIINDS